MIDFQMEIRQRVRLHLISEEHFGDAIELDERLSVQGSLVQTDSVVRVPRRHVGENDRVASLKTLEDLDGAH